MLKALPTGLLFIALVPAALPTGAAAMPFAAPWIGYETGTSAFPGNPDPFERDPYAIAAADFDGDGDQDIVVANYDYAAPGGTDGSSGFVVLFNEGDGVFAAPVHYTFTTKGSFDVVVGDFNEDGHPDLVLPNSGRITGEDGNTVVVFLNNGNGGFSQAGEFMVGERPMCLATGDFDGDGHLDIVADSYRYDSRNIAVLFGTGTGSFLARVLVPVVNVPNNVAAADLDADGYDDILVNVLGDLYLVPSDGAGGFLTPVMISEDGSQPIVGRMAAGDIDGDGHLDIVHGVSQTSGQYAGMDVAVRLGGGDGTFGAPIYYDSIAGTTPEAIELLDFDGDGDRDVVMCDWSGVSGDGIVILFNDGTGNLGGVHHVPAAQGTQDIAVADVDGNGTLDVVTADRMSLAVTVHLNPGDGLLPVLSTRHAAPASNNRLDVGDVDGDGHPDVFTSGEAFGVPGGLLRNNGDGTFAPPVVYTHSPDYGRGASRAKLRDLDGDGDLDLLYNDAHTDFQEGYNYYTALNDGSGTFGPIAMWFINTCGTGDVDAFDLDNDGDLDVVNLEELNCAGQDFGNRVFVSLNNGDATFVHLPPFSISPGPRAVAGGDFNEDGIIDLVTAHWTPYGLRTVINVMLGHGDGTFQPAVVHAVGKGPMDVVVADLDGDGHLDLATANSGSDDLLTNQETMSVLWGAGDGSFSPATTYYAPFSPDLLGATGIAAGDVDGDGDLDLMVTTVANGVAMYYNDGARGFDFAHRLGIYWRPFDPFYADFDGDGVPDLATLVNGGELAILPGLGNAPSAVAPEETRESSDPFDGLALSAANPNPFNRSAQFSLAVDVPQLVSIKVFDLRGRRVGVLHDGLLAAGTHLFTLAADDRPSGLYFVRVEGPTVRATRRVMLVR